MNARNERHDLTAKVERDAFAAASLAEDSLQSGKTSPTLQALAARYRRSTGGRIVIVDRRGRSIADSAPDDAGRAVVRLASGDRGGAARQRPSTGSAPRRRCTITCSTSPCPSPRPGACSARCGSPIRRRRSTAASNRYRLSLLGCRADRARSRRTSIGLLLSRSSRGRCVGSRQSRRGSGVASSMPARRRSDGPPEVRRLARQLNRTTAKLAALITSQEQFVADASHELRTPLTALRLRLENERDARPRSSRSSASRGSSRSCSRSRGRRRGERR